MQAYRKLTAQYQIPGLDTARQETVHPLVRVVSCLEAGAHLLEMYRRTLSVKRQAITLRRLLNRLEKVSHLLKCLDRPKPPRGKK